MLYKNIKVEFISFVVYLGEDRKDNDYRTNENCVLDILINKGYKNIDFSVENPIEDMVYINFNDYDFESKAHREDIIKVIYKQLGEFFNEVRINLHLGGFIEGEGNSIDLTLEEFSKLF